METRNTRHGVRRAVAAASTLAGVGLAAFEWRGAFGGAFAYVLVVGLVVNLVLLVLADRPARVAAVALPCAVVSAAAVPALFVALAPSAAAASRRAVLVTSAALAFFTGTAFLVRERFYPLGDSGWSIVLALAVATAVAAAHPSLREGRAAEPDAMPAGGLGAPLREWLSRQIHDRIGRRLTLVSLQSRSLAAHGGGPDGELVRELDRIAEQVDEALGDLEVLVQSIAEDAPAAGAEPAYRELPLTRLVEHIRALGIEVGATIDPRADSLDAPLRSLAFDAAHEGLVNAAKHGGPGRLELSIRVDDDADPFVRVTVRSPLVRTPGRPRPRRGSGLAILARRVSTAGGTFSTSFDSDHFVLSIGLPFGTGRR